jgi:hypothetical protein
MHLELKNKHVVNLELWPRSICLFHVVVSVNKYVDPYKVQKIDLSLKRS